MYTLLLRLSAPLQAWGMDCKFNERRTEAAPTKSGILGLVAAAEGRRRDADLADLRALHVGVRTDQQGRVLRDYQTVRSSEPTKNGKLKVELWVTNRYYLEDACFLAGIESEDREKLEGIRRSLENPVFPLYLGRRSCPVTLPLVLGIEEKPLMAALKEAPWLAAEWRQDVLETDLRIFADSDDEEAVIMKDDPLSFNPAYRRYGRRRVGTAAVNMRTGAQDGAEAPAGMEHDAYAELEEKIV